MGRIKQTIKVDGMECWTLFDTGARNTYVIPSVAKALSTKAMAHPFRSALGGGVKEATLPRFSTQKSKAIQSPLMRW